MTFLYILGFCLLIFAIGTHIFSRHLDEKYKAERIKATNRKIGNIYDQRWKTGTTSEEDVRWLLEKVEYYVKKEEKH